MRLYRGPLVLLLGLGACRPAAEDDSRLRVGSFARLTHAAILTAEESGRLQAALGNTRLESHGFEVGSAAVEALFAGELDLAFLGPNPAINGFVRSGGELRIVSGSAFGGAALVVRPGRGFRTPDDWRGARLASPGVGSTPDVALRAFLRRQGLSDSDVSILPLSTASLRLAFDRGEIDGAWVPEPLASELVVEHGGKRRAEAGDDPSTVVVARAHYLEAHPDVVSRALDCHRREVRFVEGHRAEALSLSLDAIARRLGRRPSDRVAERAWSHIHFDVDPQPGRLAELAADAKRSGFLPASSSLDGLLAPAASRTRVAESSP
jgi:NitT/TauT family transport system substrate-binding protein